MPGSNSCIWFLPRALAPYMATSASRSSSSAVLRPGTPLATPMLSWIESRSPATWTGLRNSASVRSATPTASSAVGSSSSRMANSSPPSRAAVSPSRRQRWRRLATSDEHLVAGGVAQGVVDDLEVVDVHEQHEDRLGAGAQRLVHAAVEQRAVRQARERVVEGLALEVGAQGGELADRVLEVVVLQRHRHVAGQRLDQAQLVGAEGAVHAHALGQHQQPHHAALAPERHQHAVAQPAVGPPLAQVGLLRSPRGRRRPSASRRTRAAG